MALLFASYMAPVSLTGEKLSWGTYLGIRQFVLSPFPTFRVQNFRKCLLEASSQLESNQLQEYGRN